MMRYDDEGRSTLDDIDLAAAIAAQLRLYAPGCAIVVGVTHGVVTLEGDAGTRERRDRIEALVRRLFSGVKGIVNRITGSAIVGGGAAFGGDLRVSE